MCVVSFVSQTSGMLVPNNATATAFFPPSACLTQPDNAHLERPDPADPDLKLGAGGQALDVLELHALPPAAAGRLAPEEEQFLGHADGAAAHLISTDVGTKAG